MTEFFGQNLNDVFSRETKGKVNRKTGSKNKGLKPYELLEWQTGVNFLNYNNHELDIMNGEWTRAPSPQEVMSLLIDFHEGKTNEYYSAIAKDLLENSGEYFCHAIKVVGNNLHVYENVSSLYYEEEDEEIILKSNSSWYENTLILSLGKEEICGSCYIQKLPDPVVRYFYTRSFNEIPEIVGNGINFYIPEKNEINILVRSQEFKYDIETFYNWHNSRGVREK